MSHGWHLPKCKQQTITSRLLPGLSEHGPRRRDNLTKQTPCIERRGSKITHGGQTLAWVETPEIEKRSDVNGFYPCARTPIVPFRRAAIPPMEGTNAAAFPYLFRNGHLSGPSPHHSH